MQFVWISWFLKNEINFFPYFFVSDDQELEYVDEEGNPVSIGENNADLYEVANIEPDKLRYLSKCKIVIISKVYFVLLFSIVLNICKCR